MGILCPQRRDLEPPTSEDLADQQVLTVLSGFLTGKTHPELGCQVTHSELGESLEAKPS